MEFKDLKVSKEHPKILAEVERHRNWGHTLIDVTTHGARWNEYLCSCGIELGRNLL